MKVSSAKIKNTGIITFGGNQVAGYEAKEFREEVLKLLDEHVESIVIYRM